MSAPFAGSIAHKRQRFQKKTWLNQQLQHDLWHAEKKRKSLHVEKLSAA
jgi:plasmid maintenance system antidote protein VapI